MKSVRSRACETKLRCLVLLQALVAACYAVRRCARDDFPRLN
ncbi:putative lipoprotein [Burkholderia multivorans CF2]|nr:putative lipoprotein [Burkholderia multivorans CF2]